jgi:hypothetical protein
MNASVGTLVTGRAVLFVGLSVTGALVVGGLVLGASVTGALVIGALVIGALVTGDIVIGTIVVGDAVVGTSVSGGVDEGAFVIGAMLLGAPVTGALVAGISVDGDSVEDSSSLGETDWVSFNNTSGIEEGTLKPEGAVVTGVFVIVRFWINEGFGFVRGLGVAVILGRELKSTMGSSVIAELESEVGPSVTEKGIVGKGDTVGESLESIGTFDCVVSTPVASDVHVARK